MLPDLPRATSTRGIMNEPGVRRVLPEQFSESGHTVGTSRHPSVTNPILSKRVCFYKSGDPQFNGLRMVVNNRTFKTFEALLDSLSKKVPLPFGVRNITTPRGVHAVSSLDELEDGKSYICSDHRKVKPINLAMARKKPPPWYHARPASARRRTVQQNRQYTGSKLQEPAVMRTPKRLQIFRNGDPSNQCVVLLQKKTTPTYESILRYISELMQFHVTKLYTPDGRRVDGLPALIMCSGTVVATGRERFKPANYKSQKSAFPTRMRSNRRGVRRPKVLNQKKRSFTLKPRLLSPSSERFIVNQIHNSIVESSYSIHTNSHEMESSHLLESVAESEENFLEDGAEGHCLLPAEDDIEKSFRVNQDGSMTVEMKVRLTIKEEETIHWTTTVSRSGQSNQLDDYLPAPEPEQEISLLESDHMDLRPPPVSNSDILTNRDICNEDSMSLHEDHSKGSFEEYTTKPHADLVSPLRTPTPGQKLIKAKQASVESITSLTADGLQQDIIGSYFKEHIENGDITERYCMVKHTNSRPVPKPRTVGSVEANNCNNINYKSAGVAEFLQVDSCGEEVTETVMHIYEQQTCQDNFLANICAQEMPSPVHFSRPATSDTGHLSLNGSFQPDMCQPSTASEPTELWRSESISLKSDLTQQSQNTSSTHVQPPLAQTLTKSPTKKKAKSMKKAIKASPKHKVTVKRLNSPGNKAKDGAFKKGKPIPSSRYINKIYGSKSKSNKDQTEKKKTKKVFTSGPAIVAHQGAVLKTKLPNSQSTPKKDRANSSLVTISARLPEMSDLGTNGFVKDWLAKAQPKPAFYLGEDEELMDSEKLNLLDDPCLMSVADKVKCLKEKTKTPESSPAPAPEFTRNGSVRQKIRSFENKSDDRQHGDKSTSVTDCGVSMSNNTSPQNNLTSLPVDKSASITVELDESSNPLLMDLPPPPPESLLNSSSVRRMEASAASSPLYRLSSVSDIHPLSTSPTSDRAISPADHTMEMVSSIHADNSPELRDAPLQRGPSIKRAPLVSNLSLERKMSLKKASLDEYTIPKETTALQIRTLTDNLVRKDQALSTERLQSKSITDEKSQSSSKSVSPASVTTDHRMSSTSALSNQALENTQTIKQSDEDSASLTTKAKKVKADGSPSPVIKLQTKKQSVETVKTSGVSKKASANVERKKSTTPFASPANEKRQIQHRSKLLHKTSPYSQSLDLASPPVKHKTSKKSLHRNFSTDSALASPATPRKMSTQKRTEPLRQTNRTKRDEPKQIQDTSTVAMDVNTEVDQEMDIDQPLDLIRKVEGSDSHNDQLCLIEDEKRSSTGSSDLEQKQSDRELKNPQTEDLLAISENLTERQTPESQCYVELSVSKPALSPDAEASSLSDTDRNHSVYSSGIEVPCSVDDTVTDIDELCFSEEDLPKETKELRVIVEESLSIDEHEANADLQLQHQDMDEEQYSDENEVGLETAGVVESVGEKCNQTLLSEEERIENIAKKLCDQVISQSVSERVTCSEEKVAHGFEDSSVSWSLSPRKVHLVSDGEDSHVSQLKPGTRSASQSSLSFSYDSSSVITKQPEGNRVKSIREMFLAKSATDNQVFQKQNSCQNSADVSDLRAETSVSGGYQTQTSSELSSGEEDSPRKSITKGFVMRTIERLYGKKEPPSQVDKTDRPLSAHKQKKKDQSSTFSPFHAARSKTVSELSYFNSSNALDALTATRCIAFNAQVGPEDSVIIDDGRWLLQDSTALRKSVSDPIAISQSYSSTTQAEQDGRKDTEEKTPYLLFKTDSEDEKKSLPTKCTYFSLPHASDSEAVQEESAVKDENTNDCESKDNPAMKSQKNGKLSAVGTDFKIMDNKVHPLLETPSDGQAVVVQPVRGQGALNRRLPEPDMLDFLYNFCGENCPIL